MKRCFSMMLALWACGDDVSVMCPDDFVEVGGRCVAQDAGMAEDVGVNDVMVDVEPDTFDAGGPQEVCNGDDDDSDGRIDEGHPEDIYYLDEDLDGHGNPERRCMACRPSLCGEGTWVNEGDDCDDGCRDCLPGGTELCDGRNNDCDADTDEGVTTTYYEDRDEDEYGSGVTLEACSLPKGFTTRGGDCADNAPNAYPGQPAYFNLTALDPAPMGGAFDYNCNGVEEHEITTIGGCVGAGRDTAWEGGLPECGGRAQLTRCVCVGGSCSFQSMDFHVVRCR